MQDNKTLVDGQPAIQIHLFILLLLQAALAQKMQTAAWQAQTICLLLPPFHVPATQAVPGAELDKRPVPAVSLGPTKKNKSNTLARWAGGGSLPKQQIGDNVMNKAPALALTGEMLFDI